MGNKPPADMEPINPTVTDLSGTGAKYQVQTFADDQAFLLSVDELDKESDEEEVLVAEEDMDDDTQVAEEFRTPSPKQNQPEPSHVQESASNSSSPDLKKFDNTLPLTKRQLIKYIRKMSRVLFSRITKTLWEQRKEAPVSYADLRASIETYYDENIAHRDYTDKLVEASMSSLNKSSTTISDLYRGLNVITQLLKDINHAAKDDPATNKKINEAIETFAKISTNTTEIQSLDKLIVSQISDNNRKGVGYNVVPPSPTGLFAPSTIDLSNSGLKEFQQPEFEGYGFKANKSVCENSSNEVKKSPDSLIIEDWVSDCDEDESKVRILKSDNVQQKPKQANQPRKVTVLTKSGKVPVSAARPINTAAPKSFVNSVNTGKGNRVTSVVGKQGINAVKSSACWVWRPKIKADSSLELKGYLINNGYADLVKMLYDKKELAIPGQTATGKEFLNPLIVDSLPKTILPTKFVE
ncbi:hypothetical protein Tco_1070931 [Tanacetum coccineum]|uniref:Uncharacterized protein n=1 Tax=Tanacetum coccineum TaxID=301880 RepID=A0ABQ5HN35_9ASTR